MSIDDGHFMSELFQFLFHRVIIFVVKSFVKNIENY